MRRVVIACGGTGGHLSPGIATAEALSEAGFRVTLFVSRKRIDATLAEKYPEFEFIAAPGEGLSRSVSGALRFAWSQACALAFAVRHLATRGVPAGFVSFGGFLTLGPALACRVAGAPVLLHEANRIPGRAVRVMARIATRVYLPEGVSPPGVSASKIRVAGFPVRREIRLGDRASARRAFGVPEDGKMILVLGGSQGAGPLNAWFDGARDALAAAGVSALRVTGPGKGDGSLETRDGPAGRVVFRSIPFCSDMAGALTAADLAVSRSGAGSLAEFAVCGLPAILAPYPFAADNHQEANALHFEENGGGLRVPQTEPARITAEALRLLGDAAALAAMRDNLAKMRGGESAREFAREIALAAEGAAS